MTALRSTTAPSAPRLHSHVEARPLHPIAWWVWAIGAAVVISGTRNPLVLSLVVTAVMVVADRRHRSGPGAATMAVFVRLGLVVIALRIALSVLIGARLGGTELFSVPGLALPGWMAGLQLGGAVTVEMLVASFYEGLRLAALLICFGAVNALASPYRLVRCLPPVLHEVGVAVAVGVSLAPQLVVTATRVRAARRLRGRPGGLRGVRGTVMPVLEGALERAVLTAASMDVRGYGRRRVLTHARRATATVLVLSGLSATMIAVFGFLDAAMDPLLGAACTLAGVVALSGALVISGSANIRSTYRPDRWRGPEWLVAGAGVSAAAAFRFASAAETSPMTSPATWPALGPIGVVVALLLVSPAFTAPPVQSS